MANAPSPSGSAPAEGPAVDLSKAQTVYVNFCRAMGTPEELILDFALQTEPAPNAEHALVAPQRITLSYLTAKRLLHILRLTLEGHESSFGVVETTVEKRLSRPSL